MAEIYYHLRIEKEKEIENLGIQKYNKLIEH